MYWLAGIDGSGKSTVARLLGDGTKDRCDIIDKLVDHVDSYDDIVDVKLPDNLFILTADLDILEERIQKRDREIDIFETSRSLYYYDARYRDVAKYFGIPVIDTTTLTPEDVVEIIRSTPNNLMAFKDITPDDVRETCKFITEGESKMIYADPYNCDYCYIILKDTIYSHSMQSTGEIANLGKLRAHGSRYFLDMMRRNGINHAYVSINNHGVIYSRRMRNINPLEIIVKEYCEGTDKHSYYKYRDNYTDNDGAYVNGPYVRFDWRNPNHLDENNVDIRESMIDYYEKEREIGKVAFMKKYLNMPMGDKTISETIIRGVILKDVDMVKELTLKLFHTIKKHLIQEGIVIKDVCFMISEEDDGYYFWSEINQDCMRLVGTENFDKDIWRAGGSSREEKIMAKWSAFNNIMKEHFKKHPYDPTTYWEYDYYKSMMDVNTNEFTNHGDIYMKVLSKGNRRFVVKDNLTTCFPDKVVYFDHNALKFYPKYHPHVVCDNYGAAAIAIKHSARRVFITDFEFNKETIVVDTNVDRICHVKAIGDIDNLEYTMLNSSKYAKVFQLCNTTAQVEKTWLLGAVPIISEELAQCIWYFTVSTLYPTLIIQDVGGTIKDVIKEYPLFEINTGLYEEVSVNHNTYDSIVVSVDSPGQSDAFSFQTSIKSNIVELQRMVGKDNNTKTKMIQEIAKFESDPSTLFRLFLQHLNNTGESVTRVLDNANANVWNYIDNFPNEERERKVVALTATKYMKKTINFFKIHLGISIGNIPPRSMTVPFTIIDEDVVLDYFGTTDIVLFPCRPKDMPWLLVNDIVDFTVTYNTVMPSNLTPLVSAPDHSTRLCLIKKKGHDVPAMPRIAVEHYDIVRRLTKYAQLDVVVGASESYIVNLDGYDLCDAVVETGATLEANDLEIYKVLCENLEIGLYSISN